MAEWKTLKEIEVAQQHPLYGRKGWAIPLGVFLFLSSFTAAAVSIGFSLGGAAYTLIPSTVVLMVGIWALYDFAAKNRSFVWTATAIFVLANILRPLVLIAGLVNDPSFDLTGALLVEAVAALAFGIVVLRYLWTSRRIRITFRHQVREDDEFIKELLAEKARS